MHTKRNVPSFSYQLVKICAFLWVILWEGEAGEEVYRKVKQKVSWVEAEVEAEAE